MIISKDALEALKELLITEEGFRQYPYYDQRGFLTIGIGRNLHIDGITKEESLYLLGNDITYCIDELSHLQPIFNTLDDVRKIVLIDMCFNIGAAALMLFREMWECLHLKDFQGAAKEMLESNWAKEVPSRAQRLSLIMETGKL